MLHCCRKVSMWVRALSTSASVSRTEKLRAWASSAFGIRVTGARLGCLKWMAMVVAKAMTISRMADAGKPHQRRSGLMCVASQTHNTITASWAMLIRRLAVR